MLGLTLPDAIAFGSLCAALLAAFAGMTRGERPLPDRDEPPARTTLRSGAEGDEVLKDLTAAVADLAAAVRAATQAEVDRDQYSAIIQSIMHRLDERLHNSPR